MPAHVESIQSIEQAHCCICLQSTSEISERVILSCGHVFHSKCIDRWRQEKQVLLCPLDKREVQVISGTYSNQSNVHERSINLSIPVFVVSLVTFLIVSAYFLTEKDANYSRRGACIRGTAVDTINLPIDTLAKLQPQYNRTDLYGKLYLELMFAEDALDSITRNNPQDINAIMNRNSLYFSKTLYRQLIEGEYLEKMLEISKDHYDTTRRLGCDAARYGKKHTQFEMGCKKVIEKRDAWRHLSKKNNRRKNGFF